MEGVCGIEHTSYSLYKAGLKRGYGGRRRLLDGRNYVRRRHDTLDLLVEANGSNGSSST
jgi:hypothetical protein